MILKTIKVSLEAEKQRLDLFLYENYFADESRNYIQNLIKSGQIKVNNQLVKTGYLLKEDDVISVEISTFSVQKLEPIPMKLDIIYEDNDLIVLNKPKGLVVHPADSYTEPTLVHGLLAYTTHLSDLGGEDRPGIVHRLDKDTSGLLLVAKNNTIHESLSEQFKNQQVKKTYIALVHHSFDEEEGTIDAPIARHPKQRLKMTVTPSGKDAITHFKVIERYERLTLLECDLVTGRTHQIRVHLEFINHPVLADPLYGLGKPEVSGGQFLHAKEISFYHPTKKEQLTFSVSLPSYFQDYLESLK